MISRRALVGGFLAGGVGMASAAVVGNQPAGRSIFSQGLNGEPGPLAIPDMLSGTVEDGVRVFDLNMQKGISHFFDNADTRTLGINGSYLGPALKMRAGETVRINVSNNIGETSTLHWHGLHLPARADGGPHQTIANGNTWSPQFEVRQNAAMFWYHSHMVPRTGPQVYQGLAGLIFVEDEHSGNIGLPGEYGVDDIPLVLQDRRFGRDGSLEYMSAMQDRMMGMKGDRLLVNGTINPYFVARSDSLRLRILNGSNSRIYQLAFSDGRSFVQTGSDGGLLPVPVRMNSIILAPGERIDIVVDLSDGRHVTLQSTTPSLGAAGGGGMMGGGMMGGIMGALMGERADFDVLDIRPDAGRRRAVVLPERLLNLAAPDPANAVRTRRFVLGMGMMMMGGGEMSINGRPMDMSRIDEVVRVGTEEVWVIENPTMLPHPFHIHDVQFRIIDINGRPPAPGEAGLKDTVLIAPGGRVRLLLSFKDYSDPDSPYMYHCHNLEHEDAGMMGQFTVVS